MESRVLPDSASFIITEDCNLACDYCFELCGRNKSKMSKEVIHKGLDYLAENAKKRNRGTFHAMIFGGEPLLKPKLVEEIFKYGLKAGNRTGVEFTASIVTNGTQMNEEIFSMLKKYKNRVKLSIQLSVDGIKKVHDKHRINRVGGGSFDLIEENLPMFKKLFKENPHRLSVHGVTNKEGMPHLYESFKFFKEKWEMANIWFMPLHEEDWDANDVEIYRENLNKIADLILEDVKQQQKATVFGNFAPLNACLRLDRPRPIAPCGAGKTFISINAKGEIHPCHHFYFQHGDELKIGDVFKGIDDDERKLFLDYTSDDMSCPSDCEHKNCYRCIAVNYEENGSITSQVRGFYCKIAKVELEVQRRVEKELENLNLLKKSNGKNYKIGVPRKEGQKFIDSWQKDGRIFEKFLNADGTHSIYDTKETRVKSVRNEGSCNCGDEKIKKEDIETLAQGLKILIGEVLTIKENQKEILKKLNKS